MNILASREQPATFTRLKAYSESFELLLLLPQNQPYARPHISTAPAHRVPSFSSLSRSSFA